MLYIARCLCLSKFSGYNETSSPIFFRLLLIEIKSVSGHFPRLLGLSVRSSMLAVILFTSVSFGVLIVKTGVLIKCFCGDDFATGAVWGVVSKFHNPCNYRGCKKYYIFWWSHLNC